MRISIATKIINEMTSMTSGSFYLYCVVSDIKKEVYGLYSDNDEIETEEFISICESYLSEYIKSGASDLRDQSIIRDIRLYLLFI
jgi:hypothetical protein